MELAAITCKHLSILLAFIVISVTGATTYRTSISRSSTEPASNDDGDRIHFLDQNYGRDRDLGVQGIRTIEINGTIQAFYADGTPVNRMSTAENGSNEISLFPPKIRSAPRNQTGTGPTMFATSGRGCASNDTFCIEVDNYPIEHIQELLRKNPLKYADLFNTDLIVNDVVQRFDQPDEVSLCDYRDDVIYPQKGITPDDSWMYIVNTPEYRQGVRIEKCINADKSCHYTDSFPSAYKSHCRQKYVYRELVALTSDGFDSKQKFKFPACCSCVLQRA